MTSGRYGKFAVMTPEQVAVWARSALKRPTLRILDTETTGRGPRWGGGIDELVEISIVDANGTVLFDMMVKPNGTMHPEAAAKSRITDSMLTECVPFSAIAGQVYGVLQGKDVVIFNAEYDTELIAAAFKACGQVAPNYEARCAMLAYHRFSGRQEWDRWIGLDAACREAGDCLSTLALLRYMAHQTIE